MKSRLPGQGKPWTVTLSDDQLQKVRDAAPRMQRRSTYGYSYGRCKPAEFGRQVIVDWAEYANALPAGEEAKKPSEVVKALQARIAELERSARAGSSSADNQVKRSARAGGRAAPGRAVQPKASTSAKGRKARRT